MATFVIYAGSEDGEIYGNNATYATARSGGGTLTKRTAYTLVGQYPFGGQYYVHESFLSFDTSSVTGIPTSATLAVVSLTDASTQDFTVNARAYDWGSTLTTADFIAGASLSGNPLRATFATSGISGSGYNSFTSESTFKDNLTSPVRLVLSSSRTESGTTPTTDEYWSISAPNFAGGTTDDPRLTIVTTTDVPVSASDSASASEGTTGVVNTVPGASSFARDEFTGSSGNLSGHTSDSSHSWSIISGAVLNDGSGYAAANSSAVCSALLGYTPASADHTVTADLNLPSGAANGDLAGFLARCNDTITDGSYLHPYLYRDASTVYLGLYNGTTTYFYDTVANVLGSYTAGADYTVMLIMAGSTATLKINGVTAWTGTVSPTATGKVGLRFYKASAAGKVGRIEVTSNSAGGATETVTVSDGSGSVTDPSNIAKSASDTVTVTDTASPWNLITPTSGGWSQSAWVDRTPHAGAVLVKDGGSSINSFPFGVQLPSGTLRTFYNQDVFNIGWKDSTDLGANWTGASTTYKIWGDLPAGQGGGFTNVRKGASGRLHATVTKFAFGGTWETTYPGGSGWWIVYEGHYAYSDDGDTWTVVSGEIASRGSGDSFVPMDVTELPNGDLLVTGDYYVYSGASSGTWQETRTYRTSNGGTSWTRVADVADGPEWGGNCSECTHDVIDDGTEYGVLVATFASYETSPPTRRVRRTLNGGTSWEAATTLGTSQNRCGIVVTPDGDVVITRSTDGGSGTRWDVSRDLGQTFTNMGSVLSGTSQPSAGGTGGYVANKWISPFVIAAAGSTPNLGIVWGSGYDDAHGSSFFRTFTRGATAAPVISSGTGSDTATVSDSASAAVGVGSTAKTASDTITATDANAGVAIVLVAAGTDVVTAADTASATNVDPVTTSDTITVLETFVQMFETVGTTFTVHAQGMVPGTAIAAYLRWQWKGPVAARLNAGPGAPVRTATVADDLTAAFPGLQPGEYVAYAPAYPQRRLFFMVTE